MRQLLRVDEEGFLLEGEDIFIENEDMIPSGYVSVMLPTDLPGGQLPFRIPKWTGSEWIEAMTQEELDELNKPQPKEPTENDILKAQNKALADRLEFVEDVIAEMAMMIYD